MKKKHRSLSKTRNTLVKANLGPGSCGGAGIWDPGNGTLPSLGAVVISPKILCVWSMMCLK